MDETASEMPCQMVTAWSTAPGVLMGEKADGQSGMEQVVELCTFGQVLNEDASAAFDDDGDLMVSLTRILIPIDRVERIITMLRQAKMASPGGHPDKPEMEDEQDGESSPPDRD
jgi:hypothetical protein